MREILFRGKRVDNNEWVYGFPYSSCYDDEIDQIVENDCHVDTHTSTISQYTGLKDKNVVKIFEGDLIEVCGNKNVKLKVEFRNAYVGGWVLTHTSTSKVLSLGAREVSDIEVIGNIHDK